MTLSLSEADVRAAAHMPSVIDAIEDAAREEHLGDILMPPRTNLFRESTFLRMMPVFMMGSGLMGFKCFFGSMKKGVRYLVVVMRESDGEILAVVDGAYLTALRTGATSGVATRYMAPSGPATVGLIGSGLEAETNLTAVAAVRTIESVKVYSRSPENRAAFAERVGPTLELEIKPVETPEAAVADCSTVVVATNTGHDGPCAYRGEWLETGQHVVSIGSTSPFLREIDPETFARADTVVFDTVPGQFFDESGDLMAIEDEALKDRLLGCPTLPQIVVDGIDRTDSDITLFKSAGAATQDVAAAKAIYDTALELGLGRDIGSLAEPKFF